MKGGEVKVQMIWGCGRELSPDTDQVVLGGHEPHLGLLLPHTGLSVPPPAPGSAFPPIPPAHPHFLQKGLRLSAADGTLCPVPSPAPPLDGSVTQRTVPVSPVPPHPVRAAFNLRMAPRSWPADGCPNWSFKGRCPLPLTKDRGSRKD